MLALKHEGGFLWIFYYVPLVANVTFKKIGGFNKLSDCLHLLARVKHLSSKSE